MTTILARIRHRRDTYANWTNVNPTPALAELCYETDTGRIKMGDGTTPYTDLLYAGGGPHTATGVLRVNNDPGDENGDVFLALGSLLGVDVTPVEYDDEGFPIPGTGPQPGDFMGFDPDTGLIRNQPVKGFAPEGWSQPYALYGYSLDAGEILPPDLPGDTLIFDASDPAAKLLERVNTVAASGPAVTLPSPFVATMHDITLTANCTITLPTPVAGASITLLLREDATGGRTITLSPALSGATPTWVTTAGTENLVELVSVGGMGWRVRSPLQTGTSGARPGPTPTIQGTAFSADSGSTNTNTSVATTLPGTINAGDIGYMVVSTNGTTATLTPPSGWTVLSGPDVTGAITSWLLRRVMDGSEDSAAISSGTVSTPGRPSLTGIVVAGATTTGQVLAVNSDPTGDLILDVPPITPAVANSLLVHLAATRTDKAPSTTPLSAQNITAAPGWTERREHHEGRWADPAQVNFGGFIETKALTGQGNVPQSATQASYLVGDTASERSYVLAVPPPVA